MYSLEQFKKESEKHYVITLLDVVYGTSMSELIDELALFEGHEDYAVCDGIKRAIEFSRTNSITNIKKEILTLMKEQ